MSDLALSRYARPRRSLVLRTTLWATLGLLGVTLSAVAQGNRVHTVAESLAGGVGGVAVDRAGFIYSADFRDTVWRISPSGESEIFATGLYGASGNTIDAKGRLLQASFYGGYISRIDRHGNHEVFAEGFAGPVGLTLDPEGNLYVCNCRGNTISKVDPDGKVSTYAESELFSCPNGITRGSQGDLFVVNFSNGKMLRVGTDGAVSEFATIPGGGNGHVAIAQGSIYATSFAGHQVFRVSDTGETTLIAGTGVMGEKDGDALEALFSWPNGIAVGAQGDRLFINDFINRSLPGTEILPSPRFALRQIKLASLSDSLKAALQAGGIDQVVEVHQAWKADPSTANLYTEIDINRLAYTWMATGKLPEATRLFELNAESYPQSFNAYDSLGEAYMNGGKKKLAIKNYKKSLELNEGNANARKMLEKLAGE
ncbi:MAG: hypothetical protein K0U98_03690 [Deltaproteobacteria bacterium]|nr:hypothetical protein [Deltaproteobacteria bacterium]